MIPAVICESLESQVDIAGGSCVDNTESSEVKTLMAVYFFLLIKTSQTSDAGFGFLCSHLKEIKSR